MTSEVTIFLIDSAIARGHCVHDMQGDNIVHDPVA